MILRFLTFFLYFGVGSFVIKLIAPELSNYESVLLAMIFYLFGREINRDAIEIEEKLNDQQRKRISDNTDL